MQIVDVLLQPVISEKAVAVTSRNQYVFLVDTRATKGEIQKAVEHFYNVDVTKVTTSQHRIAPRRQTKRRVENAGKLEKRAYVTLKEGQQLHLLEAVEE